MESKGQGLESRILRRVSVAMSQECQVEPSHRRPGQAYPPGIHPGADPRQACRQEYQHQVERNEPPRGWLHPQTRRVQHRGRPVQLPQRLVNQEMAPASGWGMQEGPRCRTPLQQAVGNKPKALCGPSLLCPVDRCRAGGVRLPKSGSLHDAPSADISAADNHLVQRLML